MALIKRNTAYSVNDIVNTRYGIKLKCTTAGTTSIDPLILDGTSPITDGTVVWEVQEQGQGLVDYKANKNYKVGDIVLYNNKIYKCKTAHTSTATFDSTKWEEISANDTVKQVLWQGKSYTVGDVLNLTDVYTNYDCIICYFVYSETGWEKDNVVSSIIIDPSKDYMVDASFQEDTSALIKHYSLSFNGSTATLYIADNLSSDYYVGRIEGIKIGNAFKVNSATKINLLPASITVTATEQSVTLLDDITNYDIIYINWHAYFSDGGNRCHILTITKEEYEYAINSTSSSRSSFVDSYQSTSSSTSYHRILIFPYSGTFYTSTSNNGSLIQSIILDSVIGVSFNCPNNYSTDEQLIGTWIDGKPLYQITVSDTTGNSGSLKTYDLSEYGIETVVDISGFFLSVSNQTVPIIYYDTSSSYSLCYFETNDSTIKCRVGGSSFANRPCYITVKYTKI